MKKRMAGNRADRAEYVISGVFLLRRRTGIERYAENVVRELDKIVPQGALTLLVPDMAGGGSEDSGLPDMDGGGSGADDRSGDGSESVAKDRSDPAYGMTAFTSGLRNIRIVRYGKHKGYFWEQTDLPRYLRKHKAEGIFLTNGIPLFYRKGIVVLHDISLKVNGHLFRKNPADLFSMLCWRIVYRRIMNSEMRIVTVSEFSKSEILKVYRIDPVRITVAGNAWQHMEKITADESVLSRLGLADGGYYFSLGTSAPNKNPEWIKKAAALHPDQIFVVTGGERSLRGGAHPGGNPGSSGKTAGGMGCNLLHTGYLSDGEVKALMQHCKAFLFPSFYEGFGLPPLEALSSGAPQLFVSDIPPMREIFGEAASYFDPADAEKIVLSGAEAWGNEIPSPENDEENGSAPTDEGGSGHMRTSGSEQLNALVSRQVNASGSAQVKKAAADVLGRYSWKKTAEIFKGLLK